MNDFLPRVRWQSPQQAIHWRKLWLAHTEEIDGRREGFGPWLRAQLAIRMQELEKAQ